MVFIGRNLTALSAVRLRSHDCPGLPGANRARAPHGLGPRALARVLPRRPGLRGDDSVRPGSGVPVRGGYHHHIGLNTWAGRGAPRPPAGTTGLYHFAILFADRAALAAAVRRVLDHGIPLEGASDHGVSEAIYLRDPDGNGIEL